MKTIHVHYFAMFGENRGKQKETVTTNASTAEELYEELKTKFGFKLPTNIVKAAINNEFAAWNAPLKDGDSVALLPPFSGG
ncbi:MAG: MoaD/ThiS family protein [Lentisphaerota bacterium]